MDYLSAPPALEKLQSDCIVVGIYENKELSESAIALDNLTDKLVSTVIDRGDLEGKNGETLVINFVPGDAVERILLVGLGEKATLSRKNYRKVLTAAIKQLQDMNIETAACCLAECDVEASDWQWKTRQIVETFEDCCYQFTQLKSEKETEQKLHKIQVIIADQFSKAAASGLEQGLAIAKGINLTKHLADLPGNICTPTYLAEQAETIVASNAKLSLNVLEEAEMQELGMGALLSVSRGSRQPAKLIAIEYQGGNKDSRPIVIIGKGLTFDAGGISLKPGAGMDEMKYDMCGGASVLGTLSAIAQMNLAINVVGLIPSSENMPDGDANKPGDILTSMSGKTIEVLNTDAEGRLILCDTLTYAEKYDPELVIDLATLTGACLVALGRHPSGLLGNDDELCNDLINASETACDSLWRLPLWEEYQEQLNSNFADMANIGGRDAGTITAACFLSRFAEDFRWAHLDIAGTAWRTGKNKGATGRPVALLCQFLIDQNAAAS